MTFAQRRNRLTTHFSERVRIVKRRKTVINHASLYKKCYLHVCFVSVRKLAFIY